MIDLAKVLAFAYEKHDGVFRMDGVTPYIVHPIRVLKLAVDRIHHQLDPILAASLLLHDVVEDAYAQDHKKGWEDVVAVCGEQYGPSVVSTLKPVTKRKRRKDEDKITYAKDMYAKLEGASYYSLIVKTFDRIDNLNDIDVMNNRKFAEKYLVDTELLLPYLQDVPYAQEIQSVMDGLISALNL